MKIIKNEIQHFREIIIDIDKSDLERLLISYAMKTVNLDIDLKYGKVKIEEATEGSPQYTVGYKARVTIIKDLTKNED